MIDDGTLLVTAFWGLIIAVLVTYVMMLSKTVVLFLRVKVINAKKPWVVMLIAVKKLIRLAWWII
jgi:hypothetical protein